MRAAVTGASGRLGRAIIESFRPLADVRAWSRPAYDLDDPAGAARILADRPDLVIHCAAWTDVDACARQPERAMRRNADATAEIALACAHGRSRLVLISTNEVFDGRRSDGSGYRAADAPGAINPYGTSKLIGEVAAREAFAAEPRSLLIVRTAWLYGPPGNDFPTKIVAAALSARDAGTALRLVDDETGSPTYTSDLAVSIVQLVAAGASGVQHVVNAGRATRAEWALEVLRVAGIEVPTELVPASTWPRDSTPPRCAILSSDVSLRPWQEATREYVHAVAPMLVSA